MAVEEDPELKEIRARIIAEMLKKKDEVSSMDWPDKPIEVTDANFDETIKKYPAVVVDCWAPWCVPCRMIAPAIENLAKKHKGKIVFGKLNTDENFGTARKFGIMSIPTLLIFKDGKMVHRLIGALPEPVLEQEILKVL